MKKDQKNGKEYQRSPQKRKERPKKRLTKRNKIVEVIEWFLFSFKT